jgi:hypothetical protein
MQHDLTRRDVLKATIGTALASNALFAQPEQPNLIAKENTLPGTRSWLLTKTHIAPATKYRSPRIEGYCDKTSLRAGDPIQFFISTNPRADFTIDLYRTGYYQGNGARHLTTLGPFKGIVQPDSPIGPRRLRECKWQPATTFAIPHDWPSGVYIGKLTELTDHIQSYVIFILRDDRRADFIFQCSDTTWQAYNRWPSQFSLYDDGQSTWYWGPGVDISFDRPYGKYCQILDQPLSVGSGEYFLWEFPLAFWLEQHGYDVTYISNLDTHSDPKNLLRAKAFLSVGHDEYYSIEMFNNLKAAITAGLNIAFLSGNTCCGRIDPRPSSDGRPNRIFSRIDRFGPREEARFYSMDKLPHASPNENTLIGARSTGEITGGADYTCLLPDHWLFAGTNMKKGDAIPGLIGWEWHGDPAPIPGLEIVASSMTTDGRGKNHGAYTSTIHPGPKRNLIFNASTCWWADGLSEPPGYMRPKAYTQPHGPDPRVQRITQNLLDRMR